MVSNTDYLLNGIKILYRRIRYSGKVISEPLTYVLMGFYPVGFVFVVGFFAGKQHVRHLAKRGGEERYPETVERVVCKYRQEKGFDLRKGDG